MPGVTAQARLTANDVEGDRLPSASDGYLPLALPLSCGAELENRLKVFVSSMNPFKIGLVVGDIVGSRYALLLF
jgi:hypothetical protein